jgi:hypothetical protein
LEACGDPLVLIYEQRGKRWKERRQLLHCYLRHSYDSFSPRRDLRHCENLGSPVHHRAPRSSSTSYTRVRATALIVDTMAMQRSDDAVPGTVKLLDLEHNMAARHAGNGEIILVPSPSDDPDDPLNWTSRRKTMSTICVNL